MAAIAGWGALSQVGSPSGRNSKRGPEQMLKRAFMGAGVVAAVLALWVAGPAGGGRVGNSAGPAAVWWDLRHAARRVVPAGG